LAPLWSGVSGMFCVAVARHLRSCAIDAAGRAGLVEPVAVAGASDRADDGDHPEGLGLLDSAGDRASIADAQPLDCRVETASAMVALPRCICSASSPSQEPLCRVRQGRAGLSSGARGRRVL